MPIVLRAEMIIIALIFVAIIFKAVNRRKMRLQYSLIWLFISVGVVIVAFFPGILFSLASFMGIETPVNLLYLLAVLGLLGISFYLTVIVSKQENKIQRLIQLESIEKYLNEEGNLREEKNKNEGDVEKKD